MSWYCDVLDITPGGSKYISTGYIAGPEVTIGRSDRKSDLALTGYMSVSTKHAIFTVDSKGKLFFTDVGSTTGSFLIDIGMEGSSGSGRLDTVGVGENLPTFSSLGLGVRFVAQKPTELGNNALIKLGTYIPDKPCNTCVWLRLRKLSLPVSTTHLSEDNKKYVKGALKSISGVIVQRVEEAEYVVATHRSTTLKLLTALALQKPLVTPEWLAFSGLRLPSEYTVIDMEPDDTYGGSYRIIPSPADFYPKLDNSSQHASQLSQLGSSNSTDRNRCSYPTLFAGFLVLLMYPHDEQYYAIFNGCGAIVVRLYDAGTHSGVLPSSINKQWIVQKTCVGNTPNPRGNDSNAVFCVVFHDEMYSIRPKMDLPNLQELGFKWLQASEVANFILKARIPLDEELQGLVDLGCSSSSYMGSGGVVPMVEELENGRSEGSAAAISKRARLATADATTVVAADTTSTSSAASIVFASSSLPPARIRGGHSQPTASPPVSPTPVEMKVSPKKEPKAKVKAKTTKAAAATAAATVFSSSVSIANIVISSQQGKSKEKGEGKGKDIEDLQEKEKEDDDDDDWVVNSKHPPTEQDLEKAASTRADSFSSPAPASVKNIMTGTITTTTAAAAAPVYVPLPLKRSTTGVAMSSSVTKPAAGRRPLPATAKGNGKNPLKVIDDEWDFGEGNNANDNASGGGLEMSISAGVDIGSRSTSKVKATDREVEKVEGDSMSEDDNEEEAIANVGADGWHTALSAKLAHRTAVRKRRQIAGERRAARQERIDAGEDVERDKDNENDFDGAHTDDELDYVQPETTMIDVVIPSRPSAATIGRKTDRTRTDAQTAGSKGNDQRKFCKNLVRKTHRSEVIGTKDMDASCLARESERAAIEMEEEEAAQEDEQARERFNEEIFADRFSVKAPVKVRR